MVTLTKVSAVQCDDLQIIIIDTWSERGIQMSNEFKTANFIKGNILMSNHGFNSNCPKNTNKTSVAFVASPWLHILTYSILVCLVTTETCQSHIGSSSSSHSVLPAAAHPIPFHHIYHISSGDLHLSELHRLDSTAETCHGQRYPPKNENFFSWMLWWSSHLIQGVRCLWFIRRRLWLHQELFPSLWFVVSQNNSQGFCLDAWWVQASWTLVVSLWLWPPYRLPADCSSLGSLPKLTSAGWREPPSAI